MSDSKSPTKKLGTTAKIIVTSCDDGHFGLSNCGNCGALLKEDSPVQCPECGATLVGIQTGPSFGGSDF